MQNQQEKCFAEGKTVFLSYRCAKGSKVDGKIILRLHLKQHEEVEEGEPRLRKIDSESIVLKFAEKCMRARTFLLMSGNLG